MANDRDGGSDGGTGPGARGKGARRGHRGGRKHVGGGRGFEGTSNGAGAGTNDDKASGMRSRGMHGAPKGGGPRSKGDAAAAAKAGSGAERSRGRIGHGRVESERRRPPKADDGRSGEKSRNAGGSRAPDGKRDDRRSGGPATPGNEAHEPMRIARRLARAGVASRRDAEGMIADGRVSVNGKVISSPALDVSPSDAVALDGKPLPAIERTRLWLLHKAEGTVTTNRDPEGRPTVFDRLPSDLPRVMAVGRLDMNTEGLLLLTNDGGLARVLELPQTGWLRRYRVRAHGRIDQETLDGLKDGIAIDGVLYGAIEATLDKEQGSNVWLTLGLREGKNREVKNVLAHLGLTVNRLIRVSYGPFQLGDLADGAVQEIKGRTLREQLGERLIEQAGADFDAPVATPFSNKPVAGERRTPATEGEGKRGGSGDDWVSVRSERPNRRERQEAHRADGLGRLDTKPQRPGGFKRDDRGGKSAGPAGAKAPGGSKPQPAGSGRRKANVWMEPGAKPKNPNAPTKAGRGRAKSEGTASRGGKDGALSRGKGGGSPAGRGPGQSTQARRNPGPRGPKPGGGKPGGGRGRG